MSQILNFILVPHVRRKVTQMAPVSQVLIESLYRLSQNLFGEKATLLSYEASSGMFFPLDALPAESPGTLFAGRVLSDHFLLRHPAFLSACRELKGSAACICFFNPAFFLFDSPAHRKLALAGQRHGLALCCRKSSQDLFGIAWHTRQGIHRIKLLREALCWLTQGVETRYVPAPELHKLISVGPSSALPDHSTAVRAISQLTARRAADAPIYLNTLFSEALFPVKSPVDSGKDCKVLADNLRQLRVGSQTPWLFNSLLNTLEYFDGTTRLTSVPPEIHVSSTGLCNLNCRFCTYTREVGKPGYLSLADLKNLTILKQVRILRLSAGLGEPTLNPDLTDIMRWVAKEYPHIGMNFFSNGVELTPSIQQALIEAKADWINISLNAANAKSWMDFCGTDRFADVVRNLSRLQQLKRQSGSVQPLVFASMVLTAQSVSELPQLPALCSELGIDRLSGFPFFAFGYGGEGKYDSRECFQAGSSQYGKLYEQTVKAAQKYNVSLELPLPEIRENAASIVAARPLYDFGGIEQNEHRLDRLLVSLELDDRNRNCFFLWKQASMGSVNHKHGETCASHYLYPCLGPLSGIDSVRVAPVDFSMSVDFFTLWNNPFFVNLRHAQRKKGLCSVCDLCMKNDTRDPLLFPRLNECLENMDMDKIGKRVSN